MITTAQRKVLAQARRWSAQVPKAQSRPDKRRAAHKVAECLLMLTSGRARITAGLPFTNRDSHAVTDSP